MRRAEPSYPSYPKRGFSKGKDSMSQDRERELGSSSALKSPRPLPRPNSYVVPTSKRRDELRWQIRAKMLETPVW